MDTFEAIYERRSIREFALDKKIPEEIVRRILDSAAYGMSAPGGYPFWKMLVVRDKASGDLLADSAKEVAMLMFGASFEVFGPGHMWYMPRDTQLKVAEYTTTGELWTYPRTADVNFVPFLSKGAWTDTITSFSDDLPMLAQFLGFATQNMWLVGHKYGIGAAYNGMPLLDTRRREIMSEYLGVSWSWEATGCFSFGYPEAPRFFGPARPSPEGVIFSEYWGNPYLRIGLRESDYEREEVPETEIEETIRNLNLVSSFGDKPVPPWMLEKVLDVVIWGPVPENFKNWRFVIIRDKESKEFLQKLVGEKRSCPWYFSWPELQHSRAEHLPENQRVEQMEKTLDWGFGRWYTEADILILCLSTVLSWRDQPYPGFGATPMPMFSISTGCCIQNMLLAATALGLGVNYDPLPGGDPRSRELLMEYFGIPAISWQPLGVLGLGEAGERVDLPRLPLETMVYDEYWNNPYKLTTEVSK
ncbi:MAG: hypothetical protein COS88_02730 [Chloroflexi bacterium CG07_land_8_20_14_0_80_51_10]|nr:MAG: hypothetical protein COS88_02730 [Chloroflexi bacterium CG07_land_8_20_14_0_80_51_10]